MGCSDSKIDAEDSVARCKKRMSFVAQAVSIRHAFAAAHREYIKSLKNSGAAIRQFADNEPMEEKKPPFVPRDPLHPPPKPPVPEPRLALPRAHSLPPIALSSTERLPPPGRSIKTVQEDEEFFGNDPQTPSLSRERQVPFPENSALGESMSYVFGEPYRDPILESKSLQVQHEEPLAEDRQQKVGEPRTGNSAETGSVSKQMVIEAKAESSVSEKENEKAIQVVPQRGKIGKKDLGIVLGTIDDQFLDGYKAGREVSKLLEVRRSHYHQMSDDGIQGHRAEVSRILTWSRPSSRSPVAKEDVSANRAKVGGDEGLASTLDRLHAWEKKLYDEVKAGEAVRLDVERRCAQLRHQKERGEDAARIDKTKALLKSLQTKYIVECWAVDSAILEVQKLRDEQLYPQLVKLIQRLKEMWAAMFICHQKQLQMVGDLRALEMLPSQDETTEFHKKITEQLSIEINHWQESLTSLIKMQKDYPTALHEWLHLNIVPLESDKQAAAQNTPNPPVYRLCKAWIEAMKDISGTDILKDLENFSDILQRMLTKQGEELKQKRRCEALEKEYDRKKASLETFERKYSNNHMEMPVAQENEEARHPVQERKAMVEASKRHLDEEKEEHAKLCEQNSTMILNGLKDGLPDVLHSIEKFSDENAKAYTKLYLTSM